MASSRLPLNKMRSKEMNNIFMTSDKIKINELLIQHPAQQPIYSSTYKRGSLIYMVHQVSLFSRDRLPTGETRDTGATGRYSPREPSCTYSTSPLIIHTYPQRPLQRASGMRSTRPFQGGFSVLARSPGISPTGPSTGP